MNTDQNAAPKFCWSLFLHKINKDMSQKQRPSFGLRSLLTLTDAIDDGHYFVGVTSEGKYTVMVNSYTML